MCKSYFAEHSICGHVDFIEIRPCATGNCQPGDEDFKEEKWFQLGNCATCMLGQDPGAGQQPPEPDENVEHIEWSRNSEHVCRHLDGPLSLNPNDIHAFQNLPPIDEEIHNELTEITVRLHDSLLARWASHHEPQPTQEQIMLLLRVRHVNHRLWIRIMEDYYELEAVEGNLRELEYGSPRSPTNSARLASIRALFTPVSLESIAPENMECIICGNRLGDELIVEGMPNVPAENAVQLSCPGRHIFGQDCIERWLLEEQNHSCPLDRHDFGDILQGRSWRWRMRPDVPRLRPEPTPEMIDAQNQIDQVLEAQDQRRRDTPIPWWLRMLRGEPYENN